MRIAVVIPCYKVRDQIARVLAGIGPEVAHIIAVDDACPVGSGDHIEAISQDPRVKVVRHAENQGVGGAVVTGYREALRMGAEVVVKIDGDGQMDPRLVPSIVEMIEAGEADYVKGNRFYTRYAVRAMPGLRLFGNAILSLLTKLSSGYWRIFDPTNGFTAIHHVALRTIDLDKISKRYFFESDMLIRLGDIRAVVHDMPMEAVYGDEVSNLSVRRIVGEFLGKHLHSYFRRVTYWYFLRDFSLASINLVGGVLMLAFGTVFAIATWISSAMADQVTPAGTVMLATLPIILGTQFILSFVAWDISNEPKTPLQRFPLGTTGVRPPVA